MVTGSVSVNAAATHRIDSRLTPGACSTEPEDSALTSKKVTFPFASYGVGMGTIKQSSPTVADVTINGVTTTVIVAGDEDGMVYVINAATCHEMPGWPRPMAAPAGQHAAIESTPTVAYLDGPNSPPSIIVGSGSTWVSTNVGEIEAFSWDGSKRFVMRVPRTHKNAIGVFSTPAIGDVAGDGPDIVFGSWDYYIYVLNSRGKVLAKYDNAETIWSSPALFELPGRTTDDIFIGNDKTQPGECVGGYISDFRYETIHPAANPPGKLVPIWQHCQGAPPHSYRGQAPWSSPAVGSLVPGGSPDVFIGTSWYEDPFENGTNEIYAYNARSGRPLAGWPVRTDGPVFGAPAIGAIDSSGDLGVVDTSWVCTPPISRDTEKNCLGAHSEVDAFNARGQRLWTDMLIGPTDLGSPILVPLEQHTNLLQNDVLVGAGDGLFPIEGDNGAFLFGTDGSASIRAINPGCAIFNTPAVGDVVGPGNYQGWFAFETCDGPTGDGLYAFKLPFAPTNPPAWPMFHYDPQHTGTPSYSDPPITD